MRSANSTAQPRPNPRVTVVLAVVVTLLAGCVGDDEEADPPASTAGDPVETTVSSTTAAATTPEEEVEAAYMAFVATVERVSTVTNDPDDPELAVRSTDPLLGAIRANTTTDRTEGRIWVKGDMTRHEIVSVEVSAADRAEITDCVVSNDYQIRIATGEPLGDRTTSTRHYRFELLRAGQSWKVASYEELSRQEGAAPCGG